MYRSKVEQFKFKFDILSQQVILDCGLLPRPMNQLPHRHEQYILKATYWTFTSITTGTQEQSNVETEEGEPSRSDLYRFMKLCSIDEL